nr:cob(I)yrinic acid a,c-diamide adenosyltransferase [Gloeobacter morelensis]
MIRGIFVHTHPERGFEPNAMSSALRAAAQGDRVLVAQCLKGGIGQGPTGKLRFVERLEWMRPDIARVIDSGASEAERLAFNALWHEIKDKLKDLDTLVLDEPGLAIEFGLLDERQLVDLLASKPASLQIWITGPGVPESVEPLADTWTFTRSRAAAPHATGTLSSTTSSAA